MEEWKTIQEALQTSMKQEIGAMREMLANMQQEELSLLAQDRKAWTRVMMDRVILLSRLSELRLCRLQATRELEHIAQSQEIDCEILSMRDQLSCLIEKMNEQQHRIQHLEEHGAPKTSYYSPQPKPQEKKKKPGAVATYPKDM